MLLVVAVVLLVKRNVAIDHRKIRPVFKRIKLHPENIVLMYYLGI